MTTTDIDATHVSRYLRIERAAAPVRANREVALLSNLIGLAIDRGEAKHNPCREVRRNEEQPRTEPPRAGRLTGVRRLGRVARRPEGGDRHGSRVRGARGQSESGIPRPFLAAY